MIRVRNVIPILGLLLVFLLASCTETEQSGWALPFKQPKPGEVLYVPDYISVELDNGETIQAWYPKDKDLKEDIQTGLSIGRLRVFLHKDGDHWYITGIDSDYSLERLKEIVTKEYDSISIETYDGVQIGLKDFNTKVLIVHFWSTLFQNPGQSLEELQSFQQLNPAVFIITINYLDTDQNALEFLESNSITLLSGPDMDNKMSSLLNITGVPETFIFNPNGDLVDHFKVALTEKMIQSALDK